MNALTTLKTSLALFLLIGSHAALGQSSKETNAAESKYQFSKVVHWDATPVQNQGMTGTCWSFSALSFFESELIRMGSKNPEILSEMYVVRRAYEAKAERYLRMDGKTNFSEGGAFHDIPFVIRRYGIVPEKQYAGLTKGKSHNHAELFEALNTNVQTQLTAGSGITTEFKTGFNRILDNKLGKVPEEFEVEGVKYTPQSYAKAIGLNMDDYVSITSFTNHGLYEECELEIPDNWAWGESYNVALDDLYTTCVEALKAGYTIAWGADVSEKGFSFSNGIAIVPETDAIAMKGSDNKNFSDAGAERSSNAFLSPQKEITVTPEMRQAGYDGKTTTDDHGMHIVGLYTDQNNTNYFLVKNSWGTSNYPKGYLYVSEQYFKLKTINIYLHKNGIPSEIRSKLNL
jgi:bleomycin hydrolase